VEEGWGGGGSVTFREKQVLLAPAEKSEKVTNKKENEKLFQPEKRCLLALLLRTPMPKSEGARKNAKGGGKKTVWGGVVTRGKGGRSHEYSDLQERTIGRCLYGASGDGGGRRGGVYREV